jgi:hypothetical protein
LKRPKEVALKWGRTIEVGSEKFVSLKEADALVAGLIARGDEMSLEMMKQMIHGLTDRGFISAHDNWQKFVYEPKE